MLHALSHSRLLRSPSPRVCGVPTALHAGPWRTALQRWRARAVPQDGVLSARGLVLREMARESFENATCCSSLAAYHHITISHCLTFTVLPHSPLPHASLQHSFPLAPTHLVLFSHATAQGLPTCCWRGCSATTSPARSTCCPPSPATSPHSPRHHHSPPSSSRRSSRQPHVPAATLNAASPAAAPSPDHAAACVARLSSPADSAQQPVQSASAAASPAVQSWQIMYDVSEPSHSVTWLFLSRTVLHAAPSPRLPSPFITHVPSFPAVMCHSHSHPSLSSPKRFPSMHLSIPTTPVPPQHQDAGVYRISPMPPALPASHLPVQPLGCVDEGAGACRHGACMHSREPGDASSSSSSSGQGQGGMEGSRERRAGVGSGAHRGRNGWAHG
ncbi:unnamed protein product [Closterium sp. Naga37s-1]|nr:unnamed protein product [Closterium sp. Naga37s-1]